jgi:hypothetical protein
VCNIMSPSRSDKGADTIRNLVDSLAGRDIKCQFYLLYYEYFNIISSVAPFVFETNKFLKTNKRTRDKPEETQWRVVPD